MNDVSAVGYVNFVGSKDHQKLIEEFFVKKTKKEKLVLIEDGLTIFKVSSGIGERLLTILGANEKDYHFYHSELLEKKVLSKLCDIISDRKVDNIKIPLLSEKGALDVKNAFEKSLPNFIFERNLNSITPIIDKEKFLKKNKSYMRAINDFKKKGGEFKEIVGFDSTIKELHGIRWGNNRSDDFYEYLTFMNDNGLSKSFGLFIDNKLIAYIQLILTGDTSHYYYSIYDEEYKGAGSAIICYAIQFFMENDSLRFFSFGRGAEMYKHRWCTDIVPNYDLRGFLAFID